MPIVLVVLSIVALLSFLVAAFDPPPPWASIRLVALGLFLLTLVMLLGGLRNVNL